MKKFLYARFVLLAVLAMSLSFVSCSDDNDEMKTGSFLVGTWTGTVYDSGYSEQVTYVFNADKTGHHTLFNTSYFTYTYLSYSSESGLLKLSFYDGEYVEYNVKVYDDSRILITYSGESVELRKGASSNNNGNGGGNTGGGTGSDDNEDEPKEETTYKKPSSLTASYTHSCGNRFHATTFNSDVAEAKIGFYIWKTGSSYYWYDYYNNKHYVTPGTYNNQIYRTIETSGCSAKIYVSFTFSAF